MRAALAMSCLIFSLCGAVGAQQLVRADRSEHHIDPAIVLADILEAHRALPFADQLDITVAADGDVRHETAVVRADSASRTAFLRLGPLNIWAHQTSDTDTLVRVMHSNNSGEYFEETLRTGSPADALGRVLPPIFFPELQLAFSQDPMLPNPTSYTPAIRWTDAILHPDDLPPSATLLGESDNAAVAFVVDGESARLRRIEIATHDDPVRIEIIVTPASPGDPSDWATPTMNRTRVQSIAALRPSPGDSLPGAHAPNLQLFTGSDEPHHLFTSAPSILILAIVRTDEASAEVARHAATIAQRHLGPRSAALNIAVLSARGPLRIDQRAGLEERWSTEAPAQPFLWTLSPAATIDRFAPDAAAVVVLIDEARTVRAVIPTDDRLDGAEAVAAELIRSIESP